MGFPNFARRDRDTSTRSSFPTAEQYVDSGRWEVFKKGTSALSASSGAHRKPVLSHSTANTSGSQSFWRASGALLKHVAMQFDVSFHNRPRVLFRFFNHKRIYLLKLVRMSWLVICLKFKRGNFTKASHSLEMVLWCWSFDAQIASSCML